MKFQASVILEFRADSLAEAGQRLDVLLKYAQDHHELEAGAVELRMPPPQVAATEPVVLPPVTIPARKPGPWAESDSAERASGSTVSSFG